MCWERLRGLRRERKSRRAATGQRRGPCLPHDLYERSPDAHHDQERVDFALQR